MSEQSTDKSNLTPSTPSTPSILPSSSFTTPAKFKPKAQKYEVNTQTVLDPINENREENDTEQPSDTNDEIQHQKYEDELKRQFDLEMINMQQRLAQAENALHQTQQENAYLQYQQRIQYHQPNGQPLPRSFVSSVGKPEFFNGDLKGDPLSWLDQVREYMSLTLVPPPLQVSFAVTYLREQARIWWSSLPENEKMRNCDFVTFSSTLLARFRPVDSARIARTQLNGLKQLGSVTDYNARFIRLMQMIHDMSPADQVYHYLEGLKSNIHDRLVTTEFTSVATAMVAASRVDQLIYNTSKKNSSIPFNNRNNQLNQNNWNNNRKSNSTAQPIEVNYLNANVAPYSYFNSSELTDSNDVLGDMNLNFVRLQKLTPEEREQCRREGRCFKCRNRGHMANACPAGKGNFNPPNSNNNNNYSGMKPSVPITNTKKQ